MLSMPPSMLFWGERLPTRCSLLAADEPPEPCPNHSDLQQPCCYSSGHLSAEVHDRQQHCSGKRCARLCQPLQQPVR